MSDVVLVGSDRCGLDDLFLDYGTEAERGRLALGPGWSRRWTGTWRTSDGEVSCAVPDLGEVLVAGCVPVRRFSWRQRQRHRPGLQFMVSTGRLHGFESLEERSLLLALDFTGEVEEVAAAIGEHVDSLRRQTADRQQRAPASSTSRVMFGSLPADAAASAGLARIADRVLAGSADEVREQLRQLLPASTQEVKRTAWARRVTGSSPSCSDGLRDASGPLLRGFTKAAGRPQGRRNAVLGPQRWGPESIPAFLPEDWHARHFKPIGGVNPMFTRRTAALRLVQMVAGGSLGEAAAFLGIATTLAAFQGRIYSGAGHVHSGARQQPDPLGFETALAALARELDDPATPLVNYQHRRQALENWSIDKGTWAALVGRLPPVPGPQRPELGDGKRQIASIYVWVQVTSGEHYFAPRPIEAAQPPEIREAWKERRNTIWHLMHRSQPGPHYASLRAELGIIAASLARTTDAHRQR